MRFLKVLALVNDYRQRAFRVVHGRNGGLPIDSSQAEHVLARATKEMLCANMYR
jgi:hypothetical protein